MAACLTGQVILFEYGNPDPFILTMYAIWKADMCDLFHQRRDQNVYIFSGINLIDILPADKNWSNHFCPGAYTIVFGTEIEDNISHAVARLTLMRRVIQTTNDTEAGFWKNAKHMVSYLNSDVNICKEEQDVTSLYRVRGQKPLVVGFSKLCKLEICLLAGETARQKVHIFYNGIHYATLSNWLKNMPAPKPGKYVAVFISDEMLFHKTLEGMGSYLKELEDAEQKEREKMERKREKRARQKQRKKKDGEQIHEQIVDESSHIPQRNLESVSLGIPTDVEPVAELTTTCQQASNIDYVVGSTVIVELKDCPQKRSMGNLRDVLADQYRPTESTNVNVDGKLHLYAFGSIAPDIILKPGLIHKTLIFDSFHQDTNQTIYIFEICFHKCTVPVDLDAAVYFKQPKSYTVVFGAEIEDDIDTALTLLTNLERLKRIEMIDGYDYSCYPKIFPENPCDTTLYQIGSNRPIMAGFETLAKLTICIFANKSMYQSQKIFYRGVYITTLSNYWKEIDMPMKGRYFVVFEKDPIYSKTDEEIGRLLLEWEQQLAIEDKWMQKIETDGCTLEEKAEIDKKEKKSREKEERGIQIELNAIERQRMTVDPVTGIPTGNTLDREIYIYLYGSTKPTITFQTKRIVSKEYLCTLFQQPIDQKVHLFRGHKYLFPFLDTSSIFYIDTPGSYTVVFDNLLKTSFSDICYDLIMMDEMFLYEKNKGSLHSPLYPIAETILRACERRTNGEEVEGKIQSNSTVTIHGVENNVAAWLGSREATKLNLCMLTQKSIFQMVKVFYNYRLLAILDNCFSFIDSTKPGKYTVVFETNSFFHWNDDMLGSCLEALSIENEEAREMEKKQEEMDSQTKLEEIVGDSFPTEEKAAPPDPLENKICEQADVAMADNMALATEPMDTPIVTAGGVVNQIGRQVDHAEENSLENNISEQAGVAMGDNTAFATIGAVGNQLNRRVEEEQQKEEKVSPREVLIYEPGSLTPKLTLPHPDAISKKELCKRLNEPIDQGFHVFKAGKYACTVEKQNTTLIFDEPGPYTVAFKSQMFCDFDSLKCFMNLMYEMMDFATKKGSYSNEYLYYFTSGIVPQIKGNRIAETGGQPIAAIYGVGDSQPVARWPHPNITKLYLCAIFDKSLYNDLMVFRENELLCTVRNCFALVDLSKPGKYTVVFEMDVLYRLEISEIEKELKRMDDEKLAKQEEKKRNKTEKNRQKREKKKNKKLQRKEMYDQKNGHSNPPVAVAVTPCTEAEDFAHKVTSDSPEKTKNEEKDVGEEIEPLFEEEQANDLLDAPLLNPNVRVKNRFASLDLDDPIDGVNNSKKSEDTAASAGQLISPAPSRPSPSQREIDQDGKAKKGNWSPVATKKAKNQGKWSKREDDANYSAHKKYENNRMRVEEYLSEYEHLKEDFEEKMDKMEYERRNYTKARIQPDVFQNYLEEFPPLQKSITVGNDTAAKKQTRTGPSQFPTVPGQRKMPFDIWKASNDNRVVEKTQKFNQPNQKSPSECPQKLAENKDEFTDNVAVKRQVNKANVSTVANTDPVRGDNSNNIESEGHMEVFQDEEKDEEAHLPTLSVSPEWNQLEHESRQLSPWLTSPEKLDLTVFLDDDFSEDGKEPPHGISSLPESLNTEYSTVVRGTSFDGKDENISGEAAVVVGIHPRGLIVQSLPSRKDKSKFFLLDELSTCNSSHRFNVAKANAKLIHVFLTIISDSPLQTPIINENKPDTEEREKIERRIQQYALVKDTWCQNQKAYRRGQKEQDKYMPERRIQKLVCQVMETEEEGRKDLIRVVGPQHDAHLSYLAQVDNVRMKDDFNRPSNFKKHEYFMATSMTADPFFKQNFMFNTLCIIKKYAQEELHNQGERRWQEVYEAMEECLSVPGEESILLKHYKDDKITTPPGDPLLYDIRKLDRDEEKWIKTCHRDIKMRPIMSKSALRRKIQRLRKHGSEFDVEVSEYEKYRRYIHNPAVCTCRFNSYKALRDSQLYTIKKTRARLIDDHKGGSLILIKLSPEQIKQVLDNNSPWRPGTELKLTHPAFTRVKQSRWGPRKKNDVNVVIDKIEKPEKNMKTKAIITLRPAKSSKDLFDIVRKFSNEVDFSKEYSQIGPAPRDGASETYAIGLQKFKAFYQSSRLFNQWLGYEDPENVEDVSYQNEMSPFIEIRNGITLDGSQSRSVQHAFHRKGINCIRAGPGSGKTLLIAALTDWCYQVRGQQRMIITATTNLAVNNVVEKIVALQPGIPITREMSKNGEIDVSKKLELYNLSHQCINSESNHPLLIKVLEEFKKVEAYYRKAKTLRKKLNRYEMKHYAESKLKRYYLRVAVPFCGASTPALLVRHADHYNWVLDPNRPDRLTRSDMKHLVVDEASQMPYHAFLSMMCSYPNLEWITVIGDLKQLGPHNTLYNETGLLNDLCNLSELDRINGLKTVLETYLEMNYRSSPFLVIQFIQAYHGVNFKPALTAADRTLAYDKELPLFNTETVDTVKPVAFINIELGEDCQNESERQGVFKLLRKLAQRDVEPTGITIVCFHRKQKEELEKCLQEVGRGPNEKLRKFVNQISAHTVNSFQGRENDIIILCTTKTIKESSRDKAPRIFEFVADKRRGLVAVSRAKEALYVFGQWQNLKHTAFWKNHVAVIQKEGLLFDEEWNPTWC